VVADAGPLIALARIGRLSLLRELVGTVFVPEAVVAECVGDCSRPGAVAIQAALAEGLLVARRSEPTAELETLAQLLDLGEAEALSLAIAEGISVLMDERRGRGVARHLGVPVIGTGGVLIVAKQAHLVDTVAPLVDELQRCDYRLSTPLIAEILHRCGEGGHSPQKHFG